MKNWRRYPVSPYNFVHFPESRHKIYRQTTSSSKAEQGGPRWFPTGAEITVMATATAAIVVKDTQLLMDYTPCGFKSAFWLSESQLVSARYLDTSAFWYLALFHISPFKTFMFWIHERRKIWRSESTCSFIKDRNSLAISLCELDATIPRRLF